MNSFMQRLLNQIRPPQITLPPGTRALANPARRVEIPVDFPDIVYASYPTSPHDEYYEAFKTIFTNPLEEDWTRTDQEISTLLSLSLERHNMSFDAVKRITIAYPHKDPSRFLTPCLNEGAQMAQRVVNRLRKIHPHISWIEADGIVETQSLDRSNKFWGQRSIAALTKRQSFAYRPDLQTENLPFVQADNKEPELFFLVDDSVEQGTTMAQLISYITHNGGIVLGAAVAGTAGRDIIDPLRLPQMRIGYCYEVPALPEMFTDPARNTAALPGLAAAFAHSAEEAGRKHQTASYCLEAFRAALLPHGLDVFGLTNGECTRLFKTIDYSQTRGHCSFPTLLRDLERCAPR